MSKKVVNYTFTSLRQEIIHCRKCPRLVDFRETVPTKLAFKDQEYWRKPVPGFGDEKGWLLITGLAPSAHGGNRTGRIFTGDASGRFLMNALYKRGFANQPLSEENNDGLKLSGCYITASVKCAPPKDKPSLQECLNCFPYYQQELALLSNLKAILVLGKIAFDTYKLFVKGHLAKAPKWKFSHGACYQEHSLPKLYVSYHPSPQNTNTGKLTEEMFVGLLQSIRHDYEDLY